MCRAVAQQLLEHVTLSLGKRLIELCNMQEVGTNVRQGGNQCTDLVAQLEDEMSGKGFVIEAASGLHEGDKSGAGNHTGWAGTGQKILLFSGFVHGQFAPARRSYSIAIACGNQDASERGRGCDPPLQEPGLLANRRSG